jgi:cyclin-dependent kinase-like
MEKFQKNQRYIGMKFPEIVKTETIEKRYAGKMCANGLGFLKLCLMMDPSKRLTSLECLEHPYL